MRELVSLPKVGEFTQGAIFNCLRIQGGAHTHGLVISARCDIAHSKSKTVLCLPIFSLDRWMASVGNQEIISQGGKAVDNLASDILAKYGLARKSIHVYGYDRTIAVLRSKNISKGDLERLETFQPFLCEQKISSTIKPLKEAHNKLLDSVWRNTRVDTHFLERIHSGESPAGYVIDFTQPITQYREVLDELALGLERYKYIRNSSDKYANLDLGEQDQGEVVSILQSPYIEHVLQRFTYYYSRIGTKDIAQADLLCLKGKYEIV